MSDGWCASGQLTAGGASLEYACTGPEPEDAPTIVLLHEGLGCLARWRNFPKALNAATGFGVMAYSRAGYGQSDASDLPRPLDYLTHEAIDVLPEVLDAIGFRRGVLMGHSDGATIAAIYSGSVADMRVRGLVLMAPHFFAEEIGLAEIARAREAFENGDLAERLGKYHRDVDCAFRGWNDAWLDPGFREFDVTDVIDYVRVPVLAIQGQDDQYGTLAQLRVLEERCYAPVELCILNECRHGVHLDQPDAVLAAVSDFCARLERIEAV